MFSSFTLMDCLVCHLGPMNPVLEMTVLVYTWTGQIGNERSEPSLRKHPNFKKVTVLAMLHSTRICFLTLHLPYYTRVSWVPPLTREEEQQNGKRIDEALES